MKFAPKVSILTKLIPLHRTTVLPWRLLETDTLVGASSKSMRETDSLISRGINKQLDANEFRPDLYPSEDSGGGKDPVIWLMRAVSLFLHILSD